MRASGVEMLQLAVALLFRFARWAEHLMPTVWSMLSGVCCRRHVVPTDKVRPRTFRSRPRETVFFALKSSQRVVASYIGRAVAQKNHSPGHGPYHSTATGHGPYWLAAWPLLRPLPTPQARRLGGPPLLMNELYYY